jgi:hypothetical protein
MLSVRSTPVRRYVRLASTRFVSTARHRLDVVRVLLYLRRSRGAGGAGPEWRILDAYWTAGDASVIAIGPQRGDPRVIVRVAHTHEGIESLRRQQIVQLELRRDPRLRDWSTRIPEVIDEGRILGCVFSTETATRGITGARLLASTDGVIGLQIRAVEAISELHRQTRRTLEVDDSLIRRWVSSPIGVIRTALFSTQATSTIHDSLDLVEHQLSTALTGRTLPTCRIHGDFWLGNVLVDADTGEITGIIDWDRSNADELAFHDILHLVLLSQKIADANWSEARIAAGVAGKPIWNASQDQLLQSAFSDLIGIDDHVRFALLLYWLRHTANTLSRLPSMARDDVYIQDNIVQVLRSANTIPA